MTDSPRQVFVAHSSAPSDLDRPRLSIVVPAYDEAARLPDLLAALSRRVDKASTEIVIVDDGSSDRTVQVAKDRGSWSPHLQVVEHGNNLGKGAAVRTGVSVARGELIAFLDADNATDLAALGPMTDAVAGHVGAVFGSRHAPGATVSGSPPIRGVMGRVFNHVVRIAAGTSISDTQCGAKVFWAPAARAVFSRVEIDGFAFDVEVLRRLMALAVGVVEYPVHWTYVPGTKIGPLTPLRMLTDIVRLRFRRHDPHLGSIACRYTPQLLNFAEPITPGGIPAHGTPCRVVIPGPEPSALELVTKLRAAGVDVGLDPDPVRD